MSPRHFSHQRARLETVGPFAFATCDDGTVLVRGAPPRDQWRRWPPSAALAPERARQLVHAIDEAEDRITLARLAKVIADRYVGDPCARDLVQWIERRGRQLGAPIWPGPPPAA
jgi:hypothetical protein